MKTDAIMFRRFVAESRGRSPLTFAGGPSRSR